MRCLIAENQRYALLASIPPSGRMLEWGSGGTTAWLIERLKPDQQLITVEHDASWHRRVVEAIGGRGLSFPPNWMPLHKPPTPGAPGEGLGAPGVGTNATPMEECPAALAEYIDPTWIGDVDVFLIDGVARGACLLNVLMHARAGSKIFLHDAGRCWYDWAIKLGQARIRNPQIITAAAGEYPPAMWAMVVGE